MRWFSVLALLVLWPLAPEAQPNPVWEALDGSPSHPYRFEDAAFVTPEQGWIVNGSGETWKTTDGGAFWTLQSDVPGYLRSVAFPSATKGWIGVLFDDNIRLYETRNGGTTLSDATFRIQPDIRGGICGLWAVDENVAFGVGQFSEPAYFIKTTNGGQSWASQDMTAHAGSLIDVHFRDASHGIVVGGTRGTRVGGQAIILGTEDGGTTWTERFRSSGAGSFSEWAWKISFPSPEVGYVSVESNGGNSTGKVIKTTDGGMTWTELPVPGGGSMQGVGFITPEIGWTSGRGSPMRTLDGGQTWTPEAVLDGAVNRFEFFGDTLGYAMGNVVFKLRMPSSTAGEDPAMRSPLVLSAFPNPASGAVSVQYEVESPARARLSVYDVLGREVELLHQGEVGAGAQSVRWLSDAHPAGVYLVRLISGNEIATVKVVVVHDR